MKKLTIVIYNILFGMKGNSLADAALSNLSMHGLQPVVPFGRLPAWLRKRTVPLRNRYLGEALDLVLKHAPDIICLNEILVDIHGTYLEERLRAAGFSTIFYGICKHHAAPFRISLVLATKARAEEIPFAMTMANRPGGSGGATSLYIPELNIAVLGVHLALFKETLERELEEVNAWIVNQKTLGRRMLLMGDFNLEKDGILQKVPALASFQEIASDTYPSFKTVFKSPICIDHIFFDESLHGVETGVESGLSDHMLVWSTVTSDKNVI